MQIRLHANATVTPAQRGYIYENRHQPTAQLQREMGLTYKTVKKISLTLSLILGLLIFATIADASKKKPAKVDLSYYLDSRDYNTLTLQTSLPDLPWGFNIWGFVDMHSEQKNADQRFDLTRYFIEYRLKRSLFPNATSAWKGLGFEVEYNDANGIDNTVVRTGVTYKHAIPLCQYK